MKETIKEEYDTSKDIWEFFKKIYEWNTTDDGKCIWDLESQSTDKDIKRRRARITEDGLAHYGLKDFETSNIYISGDVIFNFSDGEHYTKKVKKYGKLIERLEDPVKKDVYIKNLEKCKKNHYCRENCALLISTGNLQGAKRNIGDDRGDTFIWALDCYFREESEMILNTATPEMVNILKKFLSYYKDKGGRGGAIYVYCKDFYNIDDTKFIDKLIKSGKKAIDTPERICEYMDLAEEFWKMRNAVIENV